MMIALLIRGVTLPGAIDGIKFYLYPDPSRLTDPQVCTADFQMISSIEHATVSKDEQIYDREE